MKKIIAIIFFLSLFCTNHTAFGGEPGCFDGCFGWLTEHKNNESASLVSKEVKKQINTTTIVQPEVLTDQTIPLSIEAKHQSLLMERICVLEKQHNFGNLADIIEVVNSARNNNIDEDTFGSFIFQNAHSNDNRDKFFLACIMIQCIKKYNREVTIPITRTELQVNDQEHRTANEEKEYLQYVGKNQSSQLVTMLQINNEQPTHTNPLHSLALGIAILFKTRCLWSEMAQQLYEKK